MRIPFDTLDYAEKLERAGLPAAQAAIQSKVLSEVLGQSVAFHAALVSLKRNVTFKIELAELKLDNKLAVLAGEMNLIKWMTGTGVVLSIAILVKSFTH